MGAMCCVAARRQDAPSSIGDWSSSLDPRTDPFFWQTNSSFSPFPSEYARTFSFVSSNGHTHAHGELLVIGSSSSSSSSSDCNSNNINNTSKGSRSNRHMKFSKIDGPYEARHLLAPAVHGVCVSDCSGDSGDRRLASAQMPEVTSQLIYTAGSTSSHSDSSESNMTSKVPFSSVRTSRCSFMSKPVHPLPFIDNSSEAGRVLSFGTASSTSDLASIKERNDRESSGYIDSAIGHRCGNAQLSMSNSGSIDLSDFSEEFEGEYSAEPYSKPFESTKCGLCERLLSQRSPWSSCKIMSVDMPIAGVLSCWHVYHADCLEHITPNTEKHDPPCPLCNKCENAPEQWAISRLSHGIPRLRAVGGDRPSRVWTFNQATDCVEGTVHDSRMSRILLLNHSQLKRHLSLKGNSK